MTTGDEPRLFGRGQIVTVVTASDYGKPRPAVIVQSDVFPSTHSSVILCKMTSSIEEASDSRVRVEPSIANGLRQSSQIMVDKLVTVRREKIGRAIGQLEAETISRLDVALAFVLGLAG